jgi:tetratricopeptide (TPR) repeat protein
MDIRTSAYSGAKPAAKWMPEALDAARRALQLDPNLAEAHAALACALLLYERKFDLAEQEFQRALELNPKLSTSQGLVRAVLFAMGLR